MDNDRIDLSKALRLDCANEMEKIADRIKHLVSCVKRPGVVVALSGGIDSSVVAALCVQPCPLPSM